MPNNRNRRDYMREYRQRRALGLLEKRRPGRKPIDLRLLGVWEFEWYKAFHLLRDGTQLPPDPAFIVVNTREARTQLQWWKKASIKDILGDMNPGTPPPFDELPEGEREKAKTRWTMKEWTWLKQWAEMRREQEIASLERWLNPPARYGVQPRGRPKLQLMLLLMRRRQMWQTLAQPKVMLPAIEKACQEWKRLPDVRAHGVECFADHVLANVEKFQQMKLDPRYPGAPDADDSRLEYLARGMAGIMIDKSPLTAIARLRLMKHGPGGPLWNELEKHCECWRCLVAASHHHWETLKRFQEEGTSP